jgi:hypothetical protein
MEESDVTLVVLSCGRFDLLKLTIDSFFDHNDYPIAEILVTEDSGDPAAADRLRDQFSPYPIPVRYFIHENNHGVISCMDELNQNVNTDYILHLEDDWICTATQHDFIYRARKILMKERKILQVWLRAPYDCNGHPLEDEELEAGDALYRLLETGFLDIWHGYSNNPNLRRLADYKLLGPGGYGGVPLGEMERREVPSNFRVEAAISDFYYQSGFRAAVLVDPDGGFIHAGSSRGFAADRDKAYAERDGAFADRDSAFADRDSAFAERDGAIAERDGAFAERDGAFAERDGAFAERDRAFAERDGAFAERDSLASQNWSLTHERNDLLTSTSWRITKPLRMLKRLAQGGGHGGDRT